MSINDNKVNRVLSIYESLMTGEVVVKKKLANLFGVTEKTIQRDIEEIRTYFYEKQETEDWMQVSYDRKKKGYCIQEKAEYVLRREDVLAIIKILLESRAFNKEEIKRLIKIPLNQLDSDSRNNINEIIRNELFNYVPLKHGKPVVEMMWELSEAINRKEFIELIYTKANQKQVQREVAPIAIIFSEYYFYLIAYFKGSEFDQPIVFRIDRIQGCRKVNEKFRIPESKRFEDGEFRKRVQFMYTGELMKIRFEFYAVSREAILDRLPTARIIQEDDTKCTFEAEVFGKGILMWLLSQGKSIKVIYPEDFAQRIKDEIAEMYNLYQ